LIFNEGWATMRTMTERSTRDTLGWREQLLLTLTHWSAVLGGVIAIVVAIRAACEAIGGVLRREV
jgi:hypothetical protein